VAATIRILHLDDDPLDAQFVAMTLEAASENFSTSLTYVQTKEAYLSALERKDFDIILSDYRMPGYDGDDALASAQEKCPEIPFIMVTGELGEERVIETLQRGAADYVLKDRIFRLIPAIRHALDVAENKRRRKEAEQALRESEERYRLALASQHFILAQTDNEARYTWIHHPDLDSSVAIGKRDTELEDSEASRQLQAIKLHLIETDSSFKGELGIRRHDGLHHYEMIIEPRRDLQGKVIGLTTAGLDITERKLTEEALRKSRETLALAVQATNLGLFDYYPKENVLFWNSWAKEHFGLGPEAEVNYEVFLRGIHPDDRDRVHRTLQEALRPENNVAWRIEYRTIGIQDRKERWLDSRGQVYTDDKGEAIRFVGTTIDITAAKRVEEELRRREVRFRSLISLSSEAVALVDERGILLAVSESGAAILGSATSDLVDTDVHRFVSPTHIDAVEKSLFRLKERPDIPQFMLLRLQSEERPNNWVELEATALMNGDEIHAYYFRLRPVLLGE
jgi:PAS domain S-box-containing protein